MLALNSVANHLEKANEIYEREMGLEPKKRRREEAEEAERPKIKRGKYDGLNRTKRRRMMTMEETQDFQGETTKGIKKAKVRAHCWFCVSVHLCKPPPFLSIAGPETQETLCYG